MSRCGHLYDSDVLLHPTAASFTQDVDACMVGKHHIPFSLSVNPHLWHARMMLHAYRPARRR